MALGATHFETIVRVIVPASVSGICTAVILGMSRAIGETMVVLMVAGGAAMVPESVFDPLSVIPDVDVEGGGEVGLGVGVFVGVASFSSFKLQSINSFVASLSSSISSTFLSLEYHSWFFRDHRI